MAAGSEQRGGWGRDGEPTAPHPEQQDPLLSPISQAPAVRELFIDSNGGAQRGTSVHWWRAASVVSAAMLLFVALSGVYAASAAGTSGASRAEIGTHRTSPARAPQLRARGARARRSGSGAAVVLTEAFVEGGAEASACSEGLCQEKQCVFDPECPNKIGCNAGEVVMCRFCGFSFFEECPEAASTSTAVTTFFTPCNVFNMKECHGMKGASKDQATTSVSSTTASTSLTTLSTTTAASTSTLAAEATRTKPTTSTTLTSTVTTSTTRTTTTSTSTTLTTTTSTPDPRSQVVAFTMNVENLDFTKMSADPAARALLIKASTDTLAKQIGRNVARKHVKLELSSGALSVQLLTPAHRTPLDVQWGLKLAARHLPTALEDRIDKEKALTKLATGPIKVTPPAGIEIREFRKPSPDNSSPNMLMILGDLALVVAVMVLICHPKTRALMSRSKYEELSTAAIPSPGGAEVSSARSLHSTSAPQRAGSAGRAAETGSRIQESGMQEAVSDADQAAQREAATRGRWGGPSASSSSGGSDEQARLQAQALAAKVAQIMDLGFEEASARSALAAAEGDVEQALQDLLARGSAPEAPLHGAPAANEQHQKISQVMDMGFPEEQALGALVEHDWNVENAVHALTA